MEITYRKGRREDSRKLGPLVYGASAGVVDFLHQGLAGETTTEQRIIGYLERDLPPYTCRNAVLAVEGERILGMALSFSSRYRVLDRSAKKMLSGQKLNILEDFLTARVEKSLYLEALCVDSPYQGRGIGAELIRKTREKAKSKGFSSLSLIVFKQNKRAIRLYERHGFEKVREIIMRDHPLFLYKGGAWLVKSPL